MISRKKLGSNGASQMTSLMDECHDMHGQIIETGRHYVPGPDICRYVYSHIIIIIGRNTHEFIDFNSFK